MSAKTKNSELVKLINGMEALGWQVDSIEMLPEGEFRMARGGCLVRITVSPLVEAEVPLSTPPE
jgi:hypothetical protein